MRQYWYACYLNRLWIIAGDGFTYDPDDVEAIRMSMRVRIESVRYFGW
jgi:hypothetical protein